MMSIMTVSINTCEGTVGDERDTGFGNQGRVFRYRRNTDQFQKPYHAGIDAACIACPAREGNPCLCGHRPFENDDAVHGPVFFVRCLSDPEWPVLLRRNRRDPQGNDRCP